MPINVVLNNKRLAKDEPYAALASRKPVSRVATRPNESK